MAYIGLMYHRHIFNGTTSRVLYIPMKEFKFHFTSTNYHYVFTVLCPSSEMCGLCV